MKKYYSGFKSLENNITKIIKPISKTKKDNFVIFSNLIKNWSNIVDKKYYKHCIPQKIKINKDDGVILFIKAYSSAAAFALEASQNDIIENIACYFGYKLVTDVRITQELRMVENKNTNKKDVKISQDNLNFIEENVKNIADKELKDILEKLGKSISSKTN
jgi:hypothetical protein